MTFDLNPQPCALPPRFPKSRFKPAYEARRVAAIRKAQAHIDAVMRGEAA
jgi:hypothetical protein